MDQSTVRHRGIPQWKKGGIVREFCKLMPENKQMFWNSLATHEQFVHLIDNEGDRADEDNWTRDFDQVELPHVSFLFRVSFFYYLSYSFLCRRSISILMSIKVVKTRKSQLFIFRGLADGNTSLGGFILHTFWILYLSFYLGKYILYIE